MAQLHTFLRHEVIAFDFGADVLEPLAGLDDVELVCHDTHASLLAGLADARWVATWDFESAWYARAPRLEGVFTPAAGFDWVANDPQGRVPVHHGAFHGPMLAESLVGAMLHVNRRMSEVLANEAARAWERDFQADGAMLRNQVAVIVGYGSIGAHCARLLSAFGMEVIGVQRSRSESVDEFGATLVRESELPSVLGRADHVICLLPGIPATDGYFSPEVLAHCRGAHFYNFGRGNAVTEAALVTALDAGHLTSAVLDVTEVEPLPYESGLWSDPRVLVMPHSSCIYREYRALYVAELLDALPKLSLGTA